MESGSWKGEIRSQKGKGEVNEKQREKDLCAEILDNNRYVEVVRLNMKENTTQL